MAVPGKNNSGKTDKNTADKKVSTQSANIYRIMHRKEDYYDKDSGSSR